MKQLDRGERTIAPSRRPKAEGVQERRTEATQCHILRRSAHERIRVSRGSERLHLRPSLLQSNPTDRLVNSFDRIDTVRPRRGQGIDGGVKQAHETSNVARGSHVVALLGGAGLGE